MTTVKMVHRSLTSENTIKRLEVTRFFLSTHAKLALLNIFLLLLHSQTILVEQGMLSSERFALQLPFT